MSMRVATFANMDSLVRSALRVQAEEATATMQQSSGLVSTDFGGYGASAGRIVDLQVSIDRSASYQATATEVDTRVEQMYSSVGSMIDALNSFKSDLVDSDTTMTETGVSVLAGSASSTLDTVTSLLNTRFEGHYLFSGSATDTAPIDADAIVAQTAPSSADTSWYAGDDTIAKVRVSDDQTVAWGQTADADGFEQAIRALAMIGAASGSIDDATVTEATNLITSAIDGLIAIQSNLSLTAASLESAATTQEDYQTFASNLVTDTTSADVTEVASRLANLETQLQAAYSAIGKIQSLSLVDYLN